MPSLAPFYTSSRQRSGLLRVCLEEGQECPLKDDLPVRGKGGLMMRKEVESKKGCKNSKSERFVAS